MKRFHVHVAVEDIQTSVGFYTALFAAEPVVRKPDYAKWMLEDPRVNFAISQRGAESGIEHLGIQVEDRAELNELYARLERAEGPVLEEGATTCCYAHSEKSWIEDPQGVKWETFLTTGKSTVYGHDRSAVETTCCAPVIETTSSTACCEPKSAATSKKGGAAGESLRMPPHRRTGPTRRRFQPHGKRRRSADLAGRSECIVR